ncbi:MAG: hydrogenase formation protein HypD [Nitrososphaerota archaeon]|nr:hydrogenase formation protein HypD [Nitrososphaerales archaeon]MDW8044779.1 hydrogenase formation protein HypD [Nitrososphaerota archaeon]
MKFTDSRIADLIVSRIREMGLNLRVMHVCGTHQDTIVKNGLDVLFARCNVEMRQGPGCPVCVTPPKEFEEAKLLAKKGCILTVFGDVVRVPIEGGSLADLRGEGCDVRVVYSVEDAVKVAKSTNKNVVFMAIGFETTAPSTASVLINEPPENFYVLSCHRYVPPALDALLSMGELKLDGLIDPGHVSTIIGLKPYEVLTAKYRIPQVIAGFEPLDLLMAVFMIARQLSNGEAKVENEYTRLVRYEGNQKALSIMNSAFEPCDVAWRGFGVIKNSGMKIKKEFQGHDARLAFEDELKVIRDKEFKEPVGCRCSEVIRGLIYPQECPLFGKVCTPNRPIGPCMVSIEGSCNIEYKYGRLSLRFNRS